jgi:hypothetical protein
MSSFSEICVPPPMICLLSNQCNHHPSVQLHTGPLPPKCLLVAHPATTSRATSVQLATWPICTCRSPPLVHPAPPCRCRRLASTGGCRPIQQASNLCNCPVGQPARAPSSWAPKRWMVERAPPDPVGKEESTVDSSHVARCGYSSLRILLPSGASQGSILFFHILTFF